MKDDDKNCLTPAQREARAKAWEILTEHFNSVLIAFESDIEAGNSDESFFDCNYAGGLSTAIGMAERAKRRMLRLSTGEIGRDEF